MKTFLGLLMVLAVSGDTDIEGFLGGSVPLPCNCSGRKPDTDLRWQLEKTSPILVFIQNKTGSYFDSKYKDRAKIFADDNSSNCSLLLTNLTAADQGQYKGSFHESTGYEYCVINLNVSANNHDPQRAVSPLNGSIQSCVPFPKVTPIGLLLGFCLVLW